MNTGTPQNGVTVNFAVTQGSGTLSAASAVTNSNGYASVTLSLTNFTGSAQLRACVAPGNAPCANIYANAVAATLLHLQAVAGAGQVVIGKSFQPLTVRVIDSVTPPDSVLGASVLFQSTVLRPAGDPVLVPGDPAISPAGMPVILSASQSSVTSDGNGLASIVPTVGSFTGVLEVEIQVSAGTSATLQDVMESLPQNSGGSAPALSRRLWDGSIPAPVVPPRPLRIDGLRFDDQ
jgi:hypothetical protein